MKTRMFVAEILWLFLGLCLCPHSAESQQEINQRTRLITTRTPCLPLHDWNPMSRVRPPPPDHQRTSRTTQ